MNTDVFQILTLVLLLGLLLTLFGVLLSLSAIRRALERGDTGATGAPSQVETPSARLSDVSPAPSRSAADEDESPQVWARPTETETPASSGTGATSTASSTERSGWPSPQEAVGPSASITETREPEPTPQEETAARDTGARVLYGDTGLTTATPSEAALEPPGGTSSEPDESTVNPFETTPEPAREEPAAAVAAQEDPQEQPFERDGRWWFRRGDELLVYEEQTGQWVAAEQSKPSSTGSVGTASGGGSGSESSGSEGGGGAGQVTTPLEAAASFWKCPSCGAVNGSTATSCRMCFTARP